METDLAAVLLFFLLRKRLSPSLQLSSKFLISLASSGNLLRLHQRGAPASIKTQQLISVCENEKRAVVSQ
jgi:hypothetical protein